MKTITEFINEAVDKSNYKLTYDDQMSFERAFVKNANETFGKDELKRKKVNVSIYFDDIDCVDPNNDSTIPDVKCDGKMTWGEATEKLINYFKTIYEF